MDEAAFIKNMRSASEVRDKGEVKKLKADLSKKEKLFYNIGNITSDNSI